MNKCYRPWRSKKPVHREPRPTEVVTKWVTITEKNGKPGKRKLRVKVYKAIPKPSSTQTVVPRSAIRFRHDSTEGLGGNIPAQFQSVMLDELGPNWFQYGGGGVS